MVKRKNLGFKGGKDLVVYVGESAHGTPSKSIIDNARNSWNNIEVPWLQRIKRRVKRISIQKRASSCKWAGTWFQQKGTLELIDTNHSSPNYYQSVIIHEMAHAWYERELEINEDRVSQFYEMVNNLDPVNEYTRDNRESWGRGLYANEIHSAITEHLYTDEKITLGSAENLARIIEAYEELHTE